MAVFQNNSINSEIPLRNKSIDMLKGFLIILVILGHMIGGGLDENLVRYIIYGFHMPVFFCVSGYLINIERLKEMSIWTLLKKYIRRLIIPWMLACLVYYFINLNWNNIGGVEQFVIGILKSMITPYYHLWYVIGYIFAIAVTWVVVRFIKQRYAVGGLFAVCLLLACPLRYYYNNMPINSVGDIFIGYVRPFFLCFFILGIFIRMKKEKVKAEAAEGEKNPDCLWHIRWVNYVLVILAAAGFAGYLLTWHSQSSVLGLTAWLIMNLSLCALLITICLKKSFSNRFLEFLGRNSLAVYLYHVVVILVVRSLFMDQNFAYFVFCIAGEVLLFALVRLLQNNKVFKILILGS